MEIIGRIAVKRSRAERAKKTWLTIGLISFVVTIICSVILGNYAFLALIVPFLYLFNLRNKMGKSVLYKDVAILIEKQNSETRIEISNCEYRDKVLYSVRFTLQNNSYVTISYCSLNEKLSISCRAKKVLFLGNAIIPVFDEQPYNIQFYVSWDDANSIANKLQRPLLNVKR